MRITDIPRNEKLRVAIGQDFTTRIRCFAPEIVQLRADAESGATSLTIDGDHAALSSGDAILFGENIIVTLSGDCAAGDTTLAVNETPGPLKRGDYGQKIRDVTGYTVKFEALVNASDVSEVLAIDASIVSPQSGDTIGFVDVTMAAATTLTVPEGVYRFVTRRTDENENRPLNEGTIEFYWAGFRTS